MLSRRAKSVWKSLKTTHFKLTLHTPFHPTSTQLNPSPAELRSAPPGFSFVQRDMTSSATSAARSSVDKLPPHSLRSLRHSMRLASPDPFGTPSERWGFAPMLLWCSVAELRSGHFRRGFAPKVTQTIEPEVGFANPSQAQDSQRRSLRSNGLLRNLWRSLQAHNGCGYSAQQAGLPYPNHYFACRSHAQCYLRVVIPSPFVACLHHFTPFSFLKGCLWRSHATHSEGMTTCRRVKQEIGGRFNERP